MTLLRADKDFSEAVTLDFYCREFDVREEWSVDNHVYRASAFDFQFRFREAQEEYLGYFVDCQNVYFFLSRQRVVVNCLYRFPADGRVIGPRDYYIKNTASAFKLPWHILKTLR